jgi:hypothetical protein
MSRVKPELRDAAVRAVGARVMLSDLPMEVQTAIGDLLHAATIVERERCAKLVETSGLGDGCSAEAKYQAKRLCELVAAAIRTSPEHVKNVCEVHGKY